MRCPRIRSRDSVPPRSDVGSLAAGKVADVIVTRGEPLDIRSSFECVFIDGVHQDLSNRQTEFNERYRKRLEKRANGTPASGSR